MPPAGEYGRDTKWADVREPGLRGIAALLVVSDHISRSLAPSIVSPAPSDSTPPVLFQLPFLRCLFSGRPSVALFVVLSGIVNALKPIQQIRAGLIDDALSGVARRAFRRTIRFILPAMIATFISWLICQSGGYGLAKGVDAAWIRDSSPVPSSSIASSFIDLWENLIMTWTDGGNKYDMVQWALTFLLKGSMLVYLSIVATAYVQSKYRMLIYTLMYCYYWKCGDAVIGMNIYAGLLITELILDPQCQEFMYRHPHALSLVSPTLVLIGFFSASYPEMNPEWAGWSTGMLTFGQYIFPSGVEFNRYYPALGANFIVLGICINDTAKRILSHPALCWLGRLSLGIYLLHPLLIRTVLTWMLYGFSSWPPSPGKDEEGNDIFGGWIPLINGWVVVFALPVFFLLLLRLAQTWAEYVDPWCAGVTNWLERKMFSNKIRSVLVA